MMTTIVTLLTHDISVAFRNKTIYLIICIPLFVYATLAMVDRGTQRIDRVKIALLDHRSYSPAFLESVKWAQGQLAVRHAANEQEAIRLLTEHEVDGILTPDGINATRLRLTVMQQASAETLIIIQRIAALQNSAEGKDPNWISAVLPLQATSIKQQTMPTWILMMVLLVSFIILPAQVAEEKEKQLLLGWMQAPVRETDWLEAKLVYGIVLMLTSVLVLQLMGGSPSFAHGMAYLVTLCFGGFCFGATGILIGLLCRSQASARTLGVICYLPMLLPPALSDMSQELKSISTLIPSCYFYEPIRAMFLEDSGHGDYSRSWLILVILGLLACLTSSRLMTKRWLM